MPTFSVELSSLWRKRRKAIGRDLTAEEGTVLEGELFEIWIQDKRYDDLIRYVLHSFGRDGGQIEIAILGHALTESNDIERIHKLFRSLLSRRLRGYWEFWPEAKDGHIGCMFQAAKHMSDTMEIYVEYFVRLNKAGLEQEQELIRKEMLHFQKRELPKSFKPGGLQ